MPQIWPKTKSDGLPYYEPELIRKDTSIIARGSKLEFGRGKELHLRAFLPKGNGNGDGDGK